MIKITPSDRKWLQSHFPGMRVLSPRRMQGEFAFRALLVDKEARRLQLFYGPVEESVKEKNEFVEDRFQIRVDFAENSLPQIRDTEGRLAARADKLGKSLMDMHVYPDTGNLCVAHPCSIADTIWEHPGLQEFVERFMLPYFYFHGYWEKHGEEPWKGLDHDFGVATLEQISIYKDQPERLRRYADYVRRMLSVNGQFLSGLARDNATPEAKEGATILIKWLLSSGKP